MRNRGDSRSSVSSDDIPLIEPRKSDTSDIYGHKLPQSTTRKRQRGQKKTKKHKDIGATKEDPPPKDVPRESEAGLTSDNPTENGATSQRPAVLDPVLPAKKNNNRKGSKRKDGYDPSDLSSVVIPSADRIEQTTRTTNVNPDHVVQKPLLDPKANVRDREINQLKRRYGPSIEVSMYEYNIPFVPSDPDFPYELPALLISLEVPAQYPRQPVVLKVKNGLEIGFSRNIEREFDVSDCGYGYAGRGLLGIMTWLDRNLERILAMKKSETIKIVRPKTSATTTAVSEHQPSTDDSIATATHHLTLDEFFSEHDLREAKQKRTEELSKLRMIHPSQLDNEAFDLKLSEVLSVRLQVPSKFPLQPAWLIVTSGDETIEPRANEELKTNQRGLSRTLNWIAANVKKLHTDREPAIESSKAQNTKLDAIASPSQTTKSEWNWRDDFDFKPEAGQKYFVPADSTRNELTMSQDQETSDSDYSSGDDYDLNDTSEDEVRDSRQSEDATDPKLSRGSTDHTAEKGTAINTAITLTNISLLEPISLGLTLKCLRCKSTSNHIDTILGGKSASVQCATCSSILSVHFRSQALHQANSRIGYLDLVGASVLDLGPGTFSPTCEKCDEIGIAFKGLVSGQPQTRPCRACHVKQTVSITTTSFLIINSATRLAQQGTRDAQNLNIQRGKPLPDHGVCKHFRKSNRWFRFSCCSRVYACLICHDELTDHPYEQARSQVCGWCSKESAIRGLKPCVHCGRDLTRRSRGGFWEGGQGVRDQRKMNRNDPRKHRKKIGGSKKK